MFPGALLCWIESWNHLLPFSLQDLDLVIKEATISLIPISTPQKVPKLAKRKSQIVSKSIICRKSSKLIIWIFKLKTLIFWEFLIVNSVLLCQRSNAAKWLLSEVSFIYPICKVYPPMVCIHNIGSPGTPTWELGTLF